MLDADLAEGKQTGDSMIAVVDVGQDVGGTILSPQAVLLHKLSNATPAEH